MFYNLILYIFIEDWERLKFIDIYEPIISIEIQFNNEDEIGFELFFENNYLRQFYNKSKYFELMKQYKEISLIKELCIELIKDYNSQQK